LVISFIDVEAGKPESIIYEHHQPILGLGKLGCFDDSGIMPTSIVNVGNDKFLYSPGTALGNPATSDVRSGINYAGGTLTGTLAVPPTPSVAVGVPVDNTVGTGIFTIIDMGALLASYNV
jgi:hypothetical protein